jgi:hypothetical protein
MVAAIGTSGSPRPFTAQASSKEVIGSSSHLTGERNAHDARARR